MKIHTGHDVTWTRCLATVGNRTPLVCLRCGGRHEIRTPMPVTKFVEVLRGFDALHALCEPTDPGYLPPLNLPLL